MLYNVIAGHLEAFPASLDDDPDAKGLPDYVQREFYDYLQWASRPMGSSAWDVSPAKKKSCWLSVVNNAPLLRHVLDFPIDTERLACLTPEALRTRTFTLLRELCLRVSQPRLLVLAVENLHWIDTSSEAFLLSLVEVLARSPILLLTTFRPGYQPPWLLPCSTTIPSPWAGPITCWHGKPSGKGTTGRLSDSVNRRHLYWNRRQTRGGWV